MKNEEGDGMKRTVFFAIITFVLAGSVFAQSYTVESVTGRVQREAGNNRVDIRTGDTLAAETVIHSGIGAALVLNDGNSTVTIPAARSGSIADLSVAVSGIRISGNVARIDTGAIGRATAQVSTASARASEAAQHEDISAE